MSLGSLGRAFIADSFWFPSQASTVAPQIDWMYDVILWISTFFFVLIVALMVWFMFRYRRRADDELGGTNSHNTPLEVTWTVVPIIIAVFIFYEGFVGYLDMRIMPADAIEIQATAQKWNWQFTYPGGHIDGELHVPIDEPVRIVMNSEDVLHSFFIPAFRVKQDVVPGRYTKLWFTPTEVGEFKLLCTEYCGTKHSEMWSNVVVHPSGGYEKWLEEASNIFARMSMEEAGEYLVSKRGCLQCHSLDGSRGNGPTFKGIWNRSEQVMVNGSVSQLNVDENYIRESILMPQAKVVVGYQPVMPTFQGKFKDKEISAIIQYMKGLK